MINIEVGKRYRTRGGETVTVICVDPSENTEWDWPVTIRFENGCLAYCDMQGNWLCKGRHDHRDLIEEVTE